MKMIQYLALLPTLLYACVDHAPSDSRQFFCETLDNGISMVIVEDPQAEDSAAAMYVGVGSQSDPKGLEGLAHFLEHMLFIGTDEHPEVDALSHFVTPRGGTYNAFTARDHTQYFFSVKPDSFEEAFNIFSSFFIKPLLSEEYVERERHAVHAEFKMHQQEDNWRRFMVNALTSNLEHPANRFSIGNLDTLSNDQKGALRESLVKFYETYYSAQNMYFVAVVPKATDGNIQFIRDRLQQVPSFDLFKPKFPHIIDEKSNARFIQFKTLKDKRELDLSFLIPSQRSYYLSPATQYIANLIGDEGEGSLLANLKRKGYASGLSTGSYEVSNLDDLFVVSVDLTQEGYLHYDDVIALVQQTIQLVRKQGVALSRFQEMQKVGYLHYLYPTYLPPVAQVNALVANMPHYPNRMLIKRNYITDESIFDEHHIEQILDHLQLDNARIWLSAPDVEVDTDESIFGASYSDRAISTDEVVNWLTPRDSSVRLPGPNPFLPDGVNLYRGRGMDVPLEGESGWYMADYGFAQPKRYLTTQLVTSPITKVEDYVALNLLAGVLNLQTVEQLYPASLAGLRWSVSANWLGLTVSASGMGDKQPQLANHLLQALEGMQQGVSEDIFELVKQKQLEMIDSLAYRPPFRFGYMVLEDILQPGGYDILAYKEVLTEMTSKDIQGFTKRYLSDVNARSFYYGNVTAKEAGQYQPQLGVAQLNKLGLDTNPNQLLQINQQEKPVYLSNKQKDFASLSYIQMPSSRYADKAKAQILAQMMHSILFQELRTDEQIGYAVRCSYTEISAWPAVMFIVQSPHMQPEDIHKRVQQFVSDANFWDEAVFQSVKNSLVLKMREPFKTMGSQYAYYWDKIRDTSLAFDARESLVAALESVTYDEVQDYYQKHFIDHPRWLQIYINQSDQQDSVQAFKDKHSYITADLE